ncbi:MAG: MFS transporter [Alphaproteobacteria bacterium]|nr:MFS transporter [Alphaproteobacteria bacterium]
MEKLKRTFRDFILGEDEAISHRRIAAILLILNVVTSAAISIYIPSLKQMAIDLDTTNALIQMTIVAHLIGEFFGRLFCGPLIDTYGNKKIVIPSLALSVIGHFGCMIAGSLPVFICMRFIQATGASVVYVVSLSVINETFNDKEKGSAVGVLELYQPLAWIVSPFIGALLAEIGSWRLSFLVLMLIQISGILFFWCYPERVCRGRCKKFSVSKLFFDYKSVLKNSLFIVYALIPGFFAGGYMIFATSCPFICSKIFGNSSADIALFSAVPLLFYVASTFAYRFVVRNIGTKTSRRIGTSIFTIFGVCVTWMIFDSNPWTAGRLLSLMCLQCMGSAFLVPVSVLKALQSSSHAASVGASTVVVFRNIIMSICITVSAKFSGSITTIMACVFMTVGTVLMLMITRKIIKIRIRKLRM